MNMEFKTQIPRDTQAIDSLLLPHIHIRTKGTHLQQQSHSGAHTVHTAADPRDVKGPERRNQKEVIKMKESEEFQWKEKITDECGKSLWNIENVFESYFVALVIIPFGNKVVTMLIAENSWGHQSCLPIVFPTMITYDRWLDYVQRHCFFEWIKHHTRGAGVVGWWGGILAIQSAGLWPQRPEFATRLTSVVRFK